MTDIFESGADHRRKRQRLLIEAAREAIDRTRHTIECSREIIEMCDERVRRLAEEQL